MLRHRQKLARPGVILLIAEAGQHIGMMMNVEDAVIKNITDF
jgi:hypothetical protein